MFDSVVKAVREYLINNCSMDMTDIARVIFIDNKDINLSF